MVRGSGTKTFQATRGPTRLQHKPGLPTRRVATATLVPMSPWGCAAIWQQRLRGLMDRTPPSVLVFRPERTIGGDVGSIPTAGIS